MVMVVVVVVVVVETLTVVTASITIGDETGNQLIGALEEYRASVRSISWRCNESPCREIQGRSSRIEISLWNQRWDVSTWYIPHRPWHDTIATASPLDSLKLHQTPSHATGMFPSFFYKHRNDSPLRVACDNFDCPWADEPAIRQWWHEMSHDRGGTRISLVE